jgi:hypothetical protein
MTTYPDSTPTMNALMDLAEREPFDDFEDDRYPREVPTTLAAFKRSHLDYDPT